AHALEAGMTVEQVKAIILSSPEFYQHAGNTDLAFLQAVYQNPAVLNRPLDSTGAAVWTTALTHLSRTTVVTLILTSPEADSDLIESTYQHYLHRPADATGLSAWLAQMQHGMPDQLLTANIVGSTEFFNGM